MTALDADGSGDLSAEELENASGSLAELDADGSGHLATDEMTPDFSGFPGPFGGGPGGRGGPGPGAMLSMLPAMTALDVDGDNELSAKELHHASTSLLSLDTDEDGSLAAGELAPGFGRMPGGPGGGPGGRGGRRGGFLSMLPIMTALDADGDGELSAKEIERSSASLASIDKDGNGSLTADELRPDFGRMFGGPSAAKPG